MKPSFRLIALILTAGVILTSAAFSQTGGRPSSLAGNKSPKISKDLQVTNPGDPVDVIVQFKDRPTSRHHQKVINMGGKINRDLGFVKAGAYSLPAGALENLSADTDVTYISLDRDVEGAMDYANSTVGADIARSYGWDGTGIGVAVLDRG